MLFDHISNFFEFKKGMKGKNPVRRNKRKECQKNESTRFQKFLNRHIPNVIRKVEYGRENGVSVNGQTIPIDPSATIYDGSQRGVNDYWFEEVDCKELFHNYPNLECIIIAGMPWGDNTTNFQYLQQFTKLKQLYLQPFGVNHSHAIQNPNIEDLFICLFGVRTDNSGICESEEFDYFRTNTTLRRLELAGMGKFSLETRIHWLEQLFQNRYLRLVRYDFPVDLTVPRVFQQIMANPIIEQLTMREEQFLKDFTKADSHARKRYDAIQRHVQGNRQYRICVQNYCILKLALQNPIGMSMFHMLPRIAQFLDDECLTDEQEKLLFTVLQRTKNTFH